MKSNN